MKFHFDWWSRELKQTILHPFRHFFCCSKTWNWDSTYLPPVIELWQASAATDLKHQNNDNEDQRIQVFL